MKRLLLLAPLAAASSLSGCIIVAAVAAIGVLGASSNMDPISIQEGVATRDYDASRDHVVEAAPSALQKVDVKVEAPTTDEGVTQFKGSLKDGRPVDLKISTVNILTRVEVKVGDEDTEENRTVAREIHAAIDAASDVVRVHYEQGFPPVWDASQKISAKVEKRLQPDDRLGRILAAQKDGTTITITLQLVDEARTRVTVEVDAKEPGKSREVASAVVHEISGALGMKAEEEESKD